MNSGCTFCTYSSRISFLLLGWKITSYSWIIQLKVGDEQTNLGEITSVPLGGLESPAIGELFLSFPVAPTTVSLPLELDSVLGSRGEGSDGKYDVVAEEEGDCDDEDKRNEESFNVKDDISQ